MKQTVFLNPFINYQWVQWGPVGAIDPPFPISALWAETFEVINGTHPKLQNFAEIYTHGLDAKSKKRSYLFLNVPTDFELLLAWPIYIAYCIL